MVEIEWEDPPPVAIARVRTPGKYIEWAYAIRSRPGAWAKLPEDEGPRSEKGAANLAQNIRRGATAGFTPKGAYDAVPDSGSIWVRFVGEPKPPSSPGDDEGNRYDQSDRDPAPGEGLTPPPSGAQILTDPATVRAWAQNNGFNVPTRGRMEQKIWDAYHRAHRLQLQVAPEEDSSAEG